MGDEGWMYRGTVLRGKVEDVMRETLMEVIRETVMKVVRVKGE